MYRNLRRLRSGKALIDENIAHEAMAYYPNDATLLAMEEGFALGRRYHTDADLKKAHHYLEHVMPPKPARPRKFEPAARRRERSLQRPSSRT